MKKLLFLLLLIVVFTTSVFVGCSAVDNNSGTTKQEKEYIVTFDGDGAIGSINSINCTENCILPDCSFEKEGYIFKGWKIGDKIYSEGAIVSITSNVKVIAVWEKIVTFEVESYPTTEATEYGKKLSEIHLIGGVATIEGEFCWINSDIIPNVGSSLYDIKFVDKNNNEYFVNQKISITINKKVITEIEYPTIGDLTYGNAIETIVLSGGSDLGNFVWENPKMVSGNVGEKFTQSLTFVPNNNNYDFTQISTLSKDVEINIVKRELKVKAICNLSYGSEEPTSISNYDVSYEGFVFDDDESVVSGQISIGKSNYKKGGTERAYYSELDVSNLTSANYYFTSLGADINIKAVIVFKNGVSSFTDYTFLGDYQLPSSIELLNKNDYSIAGYFDVDGNRYESSSNIKITNWENEFTVVYRSNYLIADFEETDINITNSYANDYVKNFYTHASNVSYPVISEYKYSEEKITTLTDGGNVAMKLESSCATFVDKGRFGFDFEVASADFDRRITISLFLNFADINEMKLFTWVDGGLSTCPTLETNKWVDVTIPFPKNSKKIIVAFNTDNSEYTSNPIVYIDNIRYDFDFYYSGSSLLENANFDIAEILKNVNIISYKNIDVSSINYILYKGEIIDNITTALVDGKATLEKNQMYTLKLSLPDNDLFEYSIPLMYGVAESIDFSKTSDLLYTTINNQVGNKEIAMLGENKVLKLSNINSYWPQVTINFGKVLAKGTTVQFDLRFDGTFADNFWINVNGIEGYTITDNSRYYWQDSVGKFVTYTISLPADSSTLTIQTAFEFCGNYKVTSANLSMVVIYLDNIFVVEEKDLFTFDNEGEVNYALINNQVGNKEIANLDGNNVLKLSNINSYWPQVTINFGKVLAKGTTVQFDLRFDGTFADNFWINVNGVEGYTITDNSRYYWQDSVGNWKTYTITLPADSSSLTIQTAFEFCGNYKVTSANLSTVVIYLDNIQIVT